MAFGFHGDRSLNEKWAQSAPIKKQNGRKAPIQIPSFVYRQDGHELSYEVSAIIQQKASSVKLEGAIAAPQSHGRGKPVAKAHSFRNPDLLRLCLSWSVGQLRFSKETIRFIYSGINPLL
jgi:hypothetical protein